MISIAAGSIKGLRLKSPQGPQTRPSGERLRQGIFNVLRSYSFAGESLFNGALVVDIFAGSGAWGLEAVSNGASGVVFLENHENALSCLKSNIRIAAEALSAQKLSFRTKILNDDVLVEYARLPVARVIFADPPYEKGWFSKLLQLECQHQRLEAGGVFLYEADKSEDMSSEQTTTALNDAGLSEFNQKNYGDSTVYFFVKRKSGE